MVGHIAKGAREVGHGKSLQNNIKEHYKNIDIDKLHVPKSKDLQCLNPP